MVGIAEIGVVLAGAGARGAYEAGLLSYLLPEIAARTQHAGQVARFWFIGTSAGSLNSAMIASRTPIVLPEHTPAEVQARWATAMAEVAEVWASISEQRVLGAVPSPRNAFDVASHLLRFRRPPVTSLLNTEPLERLAEEAGIIHWEGLRQRVADGVVGGVAAAATARDGRTVVFLHRHDPAKRLPRDDDRDIDYVDCPDGLRSEHLLASSAIPVAFPPRRVTHPAEWAGWYYDGGVRLNTPLKPGIVMGLRHLVVVGTHPHAYHHDTRPDPSLPCPQIDEAAVPIANQLMADQLIQDLATLRSRNQAQPRKTVKYLFAGPATFGELADLAANHATRWTLARILRTALSEEARHELSSYLLFDPGYLRASVEAGRSRAQEARALDPDSQTIGWLT